jgi:hypothetical protein
MNIYPEDLEVAYRARIQQTRDASRFPASVGWGLAGFLPGCLFLGALLTAVVHTDSAFYFGGARGAVLGGVCGSFADRDTQRLRRAEKVTAAEISLIGSNEADPLKIGHLGLIFKLISMRPFQDTDVEQSTRSAIRAIGSGIAQLPGQPAEELLLNAETFYAEAAHLAAEAARESDPVVAASLQRQSAARSQRGAAVSRNSALARRNQILRHEMSEHIQALKTMLDAVALDDNIGSHDLAALAANIQQVAIEANSLTEAKKEVAFALDECSVGIDSLNLISS